MICRRGRFKGSLSRSHSTFSTYRLLSSRAALHLRRHSSRTLRSTIDHSTSICRSGSDFKYDLYYSLTSHKGVSNVTYLYLSAHWFEVGSLPTFQNLRHLKLVMHDCFCWGLLTELLKKSPILESLVLERKVSYCMKQYSEEESSEEDRSENEEDSEQEVASEHEDE